jgi:hypothetical protein
MDDETMAQCDADLLSRRRRFFLVGFLASCAFAATGVEIIVFNDSKLYGYSTAVLFGICAIVRASQLFLPREVVLEMPTSGFYWFAPDRAATQGRLSEPQEVVKPAGLTPEWTSWNSGIWDQELDGNSLT